PLLLRLLIGCGLTRFSMTPGAMPVARRVVRDMTASEMQRAAARVRTLGTVEEIEEFLLGVFGRQRKGAEVETKVATEGHEWRSPGGTNCTGRRLTGTWARSCT